jgi:hypothetical protein
MKYRILALILSIFVSFAGCADSGGGSDDETLQIDAGADSAGTGSSDAGEFDTGESDTGGQDEDVTTIGDVSQGGDFDHRCGDDLVKDWPLHETVSTESVTATTADGVTTLEVEASAGGSMSASTGLPFIYVDLAAGEKVELDDISAHASTDWDLAFKRTAIRTNGADSGAGDVSVAKIANTTFGDVTAAPSGGWEQDVSFDESCEPVTDLIGILKTAFNYLNPSSNSSSWYEYPGVKPIEGDIYIVDVPGKSKTYKMQIEAWDNGVYTLKIAEL